MSLFCPNNPKNENSEQMKKTLGDTIILHICTINDNHMRCMVPEILNAEDRIFCHLDHFLSFSPTNNPKNQNFEKMKKKTNKQNKTPGDIILHKCTINGNHDVWFLRYEK